MNRKISALLVARAMSDPPAWLGFGSSAPTASRASSRPRRTRSQRDVDRDVVGPESSSISESLHDLNISPSGRVPSRVPSSPFVRRDGLERSSSLPRVDDRVVAAPAPAAEDRAAEVEQVRRGGVRRVRRVLRGAVLRADRGVRRERAASRLRALLPRRVRGRAREARQEVPDMPRVVRARAPGAVAEGESERVVRRVRRRRRREAVQGGGAGGAARAAQVRLARESNASSRRCGRSGTSTATGTWSVTR